jgi:hypothetical protein
MHRIAITDHSQSSAAVRNLMPEDIPRQAAEIAGSARCRHGHSARCKWTSCLTAAWTSAIASSSRFDIVLASLHDAAGQDGGRSDALRRCDASSSRVGDYPPGEPHGSA